MSTQVQPVVNIRGFIIRGGRKGLYLDRHLQWRQKPGPHEAWVHSPAVTDVLREYTRINGRVPDEIMPALYDGENTITIGEPQPW